MVKAIKSLQTNLQMVRESQDAVREGDGDEVVTAIESDVEPETNSSGNDSDGDIESNSSN